MRPPLTRIVEELEKLTYTAGGLRPGFMYARVGVASLVMGNAEGATNQCLHAMRFDARWWDLVALVGQWHDDDETEDDPWATKTTETAATPAP